MYKKCRYLLWGAVGITSVLLILKVVFKISFVFDKVNCCLYFLIPIIWIPYHYIKLGCKFKWSVVIKIVIKYSMLSETGFTMDEQEIKLWSGGGNKILIQWPDENQLHIFIEGGKEAIAETNIYGTDRYETTIKWSS